MLSDVAIPVGGDRNAGEKGKRTRGSPSPPRPTSRLLHFLSALRLHNDLQQDAKISTDVKLSRSHRAEKHASRKRVPGTMLAQQLRRTTANVMPHAFAAPREQPCPQAAEGEKGAGGAHLVLKLEALHVVEVAVAVEEVTLEGGPGPLLGVPGRLGLLLVVAVAVVPR